jgi:hypothetical protein
MRHRWGHQEKHEGSKVRAKDRGRSQEPPLTETGTVGKVFMRASSGAHKAYISGTALEAVVVEDFVASLKARCRALPAAEHALLEKLFFAGTAGGYAAILPADDHPGKRLRSWRCFYELEGDAAQTYVSRFYRDAAFEPVEGFPALHPDDGLVIIGSQVANRWARTLLGSADGAAPVFEIARGGWRTMLHWNLHTPESAPLTTVREFRGPRSSAAHAFCERGSSACYQSERDLAGMGYLDDYLLVTALPRNKGEGQRAIVFSGLHGAGSRAVDLILREPPTALLQKAAAQIAGAPYFQILLHVETRADERGEGFPCDPALVDARALAVE